MPGVPARALQLLGCRTLHMVLESEFSGGARGVWLDPLLLRAPLPNKEVAAEMEAAARDAEVGGCRCECLCQHALVACQDAKQQLVHAELHNAHLAGYGFHPVV